MLHVCTHKHTSSVQNTAKNGTAVKILKHTQSSILSDLTGLHLTMNEFNEYDEDKCKG